jgi:hypothetical protein
MFYFSWREDKGIWAVKEWVEEEVGDAVGVEEAVDSGAFSNPCSS